MHYRSICLIIVISILCRGHLEAAEKGKWVSISDEVISQVKPGYPGKTAGATVDPTTGDVFMVVPDNGIWKSSDHGKTFARVDEKAIGGRCETGFALDYDPAGKRLMCFMIYGSSAFTRDAGKTWLASKTSHLDFGAVDWEDTGKAMIALRHESGGIACYSTDEGQTWTDLGKGYTAAGIVNAKTLLATKEKEAGILRSTDAGKTWTKVSDVKPAGFVPRLRDGVAYWPTNKGLLVSRDQGASWAILGQPVDIVLGPYFSSDPKHFVLVGKEGFLETQDAALTWKKVCDLPKDFTVGLVGPNYAWDPIANILYASSMGKETLRLER